MNVTTTDLKQRTGQVLDDAQRGPVIIEKHGRVYGAVISRQDLEILEHAKNLKALKNSVQAGFSQIENGEYSTRSMSDLANEARRRVEKSVLTSLTGAIHTM